tara:strand:+ start:37 stop:228 length:192 start_codon:yes stop_codon:yes gene_type:complete
MTFNEFRSSKVNAWSLHHCSKCNGALIGDGYTTVMHCENADEDKYYGKEPDAKVVECDFNKGE